MTHYAYIIIGGGMTADAAARGIRKVDDGGSIGLFSLETEQPYNRPPLSKGLWKGKPVEKIWRRTETLDVDLHLNRGIQKIEPIQKQVVDAQGNLYSYDRLLIATGGTPRQLRFGDHEIIYYRTFSDYQRLRSLLERGERFAVIGGGFIGSEIAASICMNGRDVVMMFPEAGIGARTFPPDLSEFLTRYYRQRGVEIHPGEMVNGLQKQDHRLNVTTDIQDSFLVDGVIAGLGIAPSTELAQQAGLQIDNGVQVDEYLQTSQKDIYAAGDVASFYNRVLDRRMRVEHEDNANSMGFLAGENMALSLKGEPESPYHHLPFFYSDLFDIGYEAVGELNSSLETVSDWETPYEKGVVYYLSNRRIRGVLLWNVWNQIEAARELIASPGPFTPDNVKGRIVI